MNRDILPLIGSIVIIIGFLPYVNLTIEKKIKPRIATFITFTLIATTSTAAALSEQAYASAMVTGSLTVMQSIVLFFAVKNGEQAYSRIDWASQAISLFGIVAWMISKNPLYAIIFNLLADFFGYVPSFYHSWKAPKDETWLPWLIVSSGAVLTFLGTSDRTLINVLFPGYLMVINASLGLSILYRQKVTSLTSKR